MGNLNRILLLSSIFSIVATASSCAPWQITSIDETRNSIIFRRVNFHDIQNGTIVQGSSDEMHSDEGLSQSGLEERIDKLLSGLGSNSFLSEQSVTLLKSDHFVCDNQQCSRVFRAEYTLGTALIPGGVAVGFSPSGSDKRIWKVHIFRYNPHRRLTLIEYKEEYKP